MGPFFFAVFLLVPFAWGCGVQDTAQVETQLAEVSVHSNAIPVFWDTDILWRFTRGRNQEYDPFATLYLRADAEPVPRMVTTRFEADRLVFNNSVMKTKLRGVFKHFPGIAEGRIKKNINAIEKIALVPPEQFSALYEMEALERFVATYTLINTARERAERSLLHELDPNTKEDEKLAWIDQRMGDWRAVGTRSFSFGENSAYNVNGWLHIHDPSGWATGKGAHHFIGPEFWDVTKGLKAMPEKIFGTPDFLKDSKGKPKRKIVIKAYDRDSLFVEIGIGTLRADYSGYDFSTRTKTLFAPELSFYDIDKLADIAFRLSYTDPNAVVEEYQSTNKKTKEFIHIRRFLVDVPIGGTTIRFRGVQRVQPKGPPKWVTFFPIISDERRITLVEDDDLEDFANEVSSPIVVPVNYPGTLNPHNFSRIPAIREKMKTIVLSQPRGW